MIICIVGATCTGKTTTATHLANIVEWPLRSCGLAIRQRAANIGTDPRILDDWNHRSVDNETVEWALGARDCFLEGRFLDSVFHDPAMPVTMIRLMASNEIRAERGRVRGKSTFAVDDVMRADAEDAAFRERLYPWTRPPSSFPVLDSSELTVDECVRRVRAMLGGALPPLG